VRKGNNWSFIDLSGFELISMSYEYAGDFMEGLAPVKLHNKWGYIDRCGNVVLPLI
jgi:hypothetical protein